MGKPLMVIPAASTRSRAGTTGGPMLFGPSPERSITRRTTSKPLSSKSSWAKSRAEPIAAT